jgi:hypothetical protein
MPTNVYFQQGSYTEQLLVQDLIVESLKIYGKDMYYIPRSLYAKDTILGEDPLSRFESAFPLEMYIEDVDGFQGQGVFLQKFGIQVEKTATFVVARKRWEQLVGKYNVSLLPNRPSEGDLIYFPMTRGLFEIKFVENQDPFYELGNLYVYKLRVELFQYSSERIQTDVADIDSIEELYSLNTLNYKIINEDGETAILFESVDGTRNYILDESLRADDIEPFANNAELVEDTNDDIDFTDRNPFGEL